MRRALAATAVLLVAGFAGGQALAAPAAPPRPPAGVYTTPDGKVCVWVSLQVPFCTPPVLAAVKGP